MDDLNEEKVEPQETEPKSIEVDPNVQRQKNIKTSTELKKVFTSKSQFKEFINFIKNGFKIK